MTVHIEYAPDVTEAPRPTLLVAGSNGDVFDLHGVRAACRRGARICPLKEDELIPAPYGTQLYFLPGRQPVDADGKVPADAEQEDLTAVAVFLPPRFLATGLAAYRRLPDAPALPLFCYAAACWFRGELHVAAVEVESDPKHDPAMFHPHILRRYVKRLRKKYAGNRLVEHLAENCALRYGCANAMNFFYRRWEMPVPVSPACNATCVGCISSQPDGTVAPPQDRLKFVPDVAEIVEIAVEHLEHAPAAMVSFGQGCEGEPLLQAELIAEAIREIRRRTQRGTIHLNTNGSNPAALDRLCSAGLDSVRISLNSVYAPWYEAYYRPLTYRFADVVESIRLAKDRGLFVSINYLTFPGVTDSATETEALRRFLATTPVDMIQWRNLNIDPDVYVATIGLNADEPAVGLRAWLEELRSLHPGLMYGYVNPPRERWPESVRARR